MTDQELWRQLKEGKQEAFESIYKIHFKDLYQYGQKFSTDISTVEDCVQELFIELWNNRANLSDTDAIKPYLYVSIKRKLIRSISKIRKSTDTELAEKHFQTELAIDEMLIAEEMNSENKHRLAKAFENLSSRQKEILYLKYYSGMAYEEISEIMDLNYQSARNLVARAIQKLSKHLSILFYYFFHTILSTNS